MKSYCSWSLQLLLDGAVGAVAAVAAVAASLAELQLDGHAHKRFQIFSNIRGVIHICN
jgi:hypothetical protein